MAPPEDASIPSSLSLRLFGPLEVKINGQPLPRLHSRKGYLLLALLALRRAAPVERSWLAGTLWPDSLEAAALAGLRNTLSNLRRALGSEADRLRSPTRSTVCLALTGADVDVLAFDQAIARADLASLEEAVALYRGPLLEGWVEEWVVQERSQREQAYLDALERLAGEALEQGNTAAAAGYLRRVVAVDALRESAQRALMQALATAGNYAAASEIYRQLRLLLHRELNAEPAPETKAVYQQIRSEARVRARAPLPKPLLPASTPVCVDPAISLLPEGTVTFLFTDIEGSTRLLQHLRDRYPEVLADHRRLLRAAFEQWNGHELGTQGDSFFIAFSRAADALAAASEAQRALISHAWPERAAVRVRMGLHTGEPTLTSEGYVGLDLHRAARIAACGHGGQILLSQATADLVTQELPVGVSLKDMGAHRLKGLLQPEHLFQVAIEGLETDFPPLKSLSSQPNNLPQQTSSFIGREREIEEATQLLTTTRLLTLTGTGGTGKTRLAVQVAADRVEAHSDGVWLVELAALTEASLVPQAVAGALHLREEPGRTLTETLCDYLQAKQLLLVLDNCEHLVEACARLAETLLRSCPRLRVLATSREALGIAGEVLWPVLPLPVPDPQQIESAGDRASRVAQYDGARLFLERGKAAQPSFRITEQNARAVAEVCHRLDGIPLAIELAAARLRALPVEKIAERLDDRFRLLTGGSRTALPRQQTLRALIDWSYDLLSPQERVLLRRLSVFAGGWVLEAAEAVAAGEGIEAWEVLDLLTALVEKSLVQYEERGGEGRYRLLETIREYGSERLAGTEEAEGLRKRHLEFYLGLAEEAEAELRGSAQGGWLTRLEAEHDNFRAALRRSAESGEAQAGLRLGGALWRFWDVRGYLAEGRDHLARLLSLPEATTGTAARAKALNGAGGLARYRGDQGAARSLFEESLAISRELGDRQGITNSLNYLGSLARARGDYTGARSLYEESLAIRRELGDRHGISVSLHNLGNVAQAQGDYEAARSLHEESLAISRELGNRLVIANLLNGLGIVAQVQEDYAGARSLFEESLTIRRELGDRPGISVSLRNLGNVAQAQGDYEAARSLYEESLAISRELEDRYGIAVSVGELAALAGAQERPERAARLFGAAAGLRDAIGAPIPPDERAEHNRRVAAVRAALDEAAFEAAWAAGGAMSIEEAMCVALEECEIPIPDRKGS